MFDFSNWNFDLDNNISDIFGLDTDGDGATDTFGTDSNGDGIIDTWHAELDTDHDGLIDTIIDGYDYDQDGIVESQTTYYDYDQDGRYEQVIKGNDADGDGYIDHFAAYQDLDGDGNEDVVIREQYQERNGNGMISGVYADNLDNFDPAEADMSAVSGNPEQSMEQWEYQGDTGRCALYSQKFVIEELTHQDIDIEELADLAEENGWFSEDSGTPLLNMDKALDYFGIDSEMSFHNDFSSLQRELELGKKIIVSIDADEIWYGEEDDLFTPGDGPNHAVEVIGIDHTDADNPMVILNDSGNPNGCGELVPLDAFLDAWEDGNCQMISCI